MSDEPDEKEIDLMSDKDVEAHLKDTIPKIQKLSEDEFRAGLVADMVGLQIVLVANSRMMKISNKNFEYIQAWMKTVEERMKVIDDKLSFLEEIAKNDDPKRKTDHYLK